MGLRKLLSGERGAAVLAMERRAPRVHVRLGALALSWPLWLAIGICAAVVARTLAVWAPEGDSALHLKLMQDIAATGALPRELPHFAARVGVGGEIEAMFPYAYTPLFHTLGAMLWSAAGAPGVALMNGAGAAVIGIVIYAFVARRLPRYVAAAAAVAAFVAPTTIAIFTHVYMEPVMLAFVFAGAWYFYVALTMRRVRPALLAGALLGLAVGTRQSALLNVGVLGALAALYLFERGSLQPAGIRKEARWLAAFAGSFAIVALPSLLYLFAASGSLGYADMSVPGASPALAVDSEANAYIAGITKPDMSPLAWMDRYRTTVLYSERWLPSWLGAVPLVFAAVGIAHMERRGGGARFFGRLVAAQFIAELLLFTIVHGNDRYVIASRMLFYSTLPVGVYATFAWMRQRSPHWGLTERVVAGGAFVAGAIALGASLFGGSYYDYLAHQQRLMTLRSDSYAEAGAWANAHTPEDALFLAPRVYTGELTFERDLTWVTFYGNTWAIDAISTPEPKQAHAALSKYGVDYVLIADPPGTYIDRMPIDGMRSYLQFGREPTRYFELVYMTNDSARINGREIEHGLRIYRVVPPDEASAR